MRAYLDIETTFANTISVIGIYRPDRGTTQLVGGGIRDTALFDALEGITTIVTFNGASFDLPFIRKSLYVDLKQAFAHCDLMYVCRKLGLRGGLKKIETLVGITRDTVGLSGYDAPRLWQRYETYDNREALRVLLEYNREDVVNLAVLEDKIGLVAHPTTHAAVQQLFE